MVGNAHAGVQSHMSPILLPSNGNALLRNTCSDKVCPSPFQILDSLTVSDSDTDVEKARELAEQVLMREEAEGRVFIRTSTHVNTVHTHPRPPTLCDTRIQHSAATATSPPHPQRCVDWAATIENLR